MVTKLNEEKPTLEKSATEKHLRLIEQAADEVIIRDITERKRMEGALKESEEKLRLMFETLPEGITVIDMDGKIVQSNQATVRIYGYDSKEEIIGLNIFEFIAKKEHTRVAEIMKKTLKHGSLGVLELVQLRKDRSEFPVELNGAVLNDTSGNPIGFITVMKDITERKQAEEKLRFSAAAFRSIQESVVAVDTEYTITHWNEVSERIYGIKASEAIGKKLFDVFEIVETSRGENVERFKKLENQGYYQEEQLHRTKYAEVWVSVSVQAIEYNGKRYGWVALATDITERKQAEEREKQLQQQLNLSSRLASVGEMASGIAHEINNPLTGVIGFAQLLMQRDIPEDIRKDVEIINDGAQRVASVVSRLLTFARQHKSGREYVNINDAITSVLELRSYEMKVNNIEVVTQLAPHLPQTMADVNQLQQVFLNIIINAEKEMTAAHHRGKLSVKTERTNSSIRVSFTDDGPGISKENLDKVFNPFFTTREVGDGTGLGLSICHGIITQHNGRIYAQSELGKGATFVVELPIVAKTGQLEKAEAVQEAPWQCRGAKILVVDDEKSILDFLKRLLTGQGYQVETVDGTRAALTRLRRERYDLILLDIKLPGKDGIWLYRHIEAMDPALAHRVLFITGDVMETTTREFLDKTKVRYIAKPLNVEQLKRDINHMLTREPLRQQS